jgi:hypothetical protein
MLSLRVLLATFLCSFIATQCLANEEPLFVVTSNSPGNDTTVIKDLKACGCEAMTRSQYEKEKPKRTVIAVSVHERLGAAPGYGVVLFANKFSKNWADWDHWNDAIEIGWFHGINPTRARKKREQTKMNPRNRDGNGQTSTDWFYDGPGSEDFRDNLRKVLTDKERLKKTFARELWH